MAPKRASVPLLYVLLMTLAKTKHKNDKNTNRKIFIVEGKVLTLHKENTKAWDGRCQTGRIQKGNIKYDNYATDIDPNDDCGTQLSSMG